MTTPEKHRIFIAAPHPVFRHGLAQIINAAGDLVVCGEAPQVPTALAATRAELILLDIDAEPSRAREIVKSTRRDWPKVQLLVTSAGDDAHAVLGLLQAGAHGYLMKSESLNDFLLGIRRVLGGHIYINRVFGEELIASLAGRGQVPEDARLQRLTSREREVFSLIGVGHDTRQVAAELHLSTKTVETHRLHIREKLGLKNAAELVHFAATVAPGLSARAKR